MSSWGSSFGPCSGGGGGNETVIVEAIREASVVSVVSATAYTPQLVARVVSISTAKAFSMSVTATAISTTEAKTHECHP